MDDSQVRHPVILPVQYLRAVAALMVVWHHARGQLDGVSELIGGTFGVSGVDLFFVISGFIMVTSTQGTEQSPWEFMRRRLIRVVPIYWLLTLLMVALALAAPTLFKTLKVSPGTLLQSLLFIPHFSASFPDQVFPLLVPGWTLSYELFFYALFALSLSLPRRLQLRALTIVLIALSVVGWAWGPFDNAPALTYTSSLLLEFAGGAWIARWRIDRTMRTTQGGAIVLIGVGATLLVFRDSTPLGAGTQIVGAMLVVIGALDARFATWRNSALRVIGDSSYSLYLTHIFTLGVLRSIWTRAMPGTPSLAEAVLFMCVALAVSTLVGWATFRWVEAPMVKLLGRRRRHSSSEVKPFTARRRARSV